MAPGFGAGATEEVAISDGLTASEGKPTGHEVVQVILNGKCSPRGELHESIDALKRQGHAIEVLRTKGRGHARELAEASAGQATSVFAAGGDGTLNEVVSGLLEIEAARRPTLGIVPLGTANDFARCVGLRDLSPAEALRGGLRWPLWPIDVAGVTSPKHSALVMVNMASGGISAEITSHTSEESKELLGSLAYLFTGITYASSLHPWQGTVTGPGFTWQGSLLGFFVGNGRYAGGGYALCPKAALDDGLLDVTMIPELPTEELLEIAGWLLTGGDVSDWESIVAVQLPWVELSVADPVQINLDGEPTQGTRFRMEILPETLKVHLPEHTHQRFPGLLQPR